MTVRQPVRGPERDPLDFLRRLKAQLDALARDVQGLTARTGQRYGYDTGVPHAYVAERLFEPETASFTLDLLGRGDNAATQQPVNYVVRDGVEHTVPLHMDGPGVFCARAFVVTFYQRWWSEARSRPFWLPVPYGRSFDNVSNTEGGTKVQTIKWSCMHQQTFQTWPNTLRNTDLSGAPAHEADVCGINFFWNLVDQDSQRQFADQPMSDVVLLSQGYHGQNDGGIFEFDTPWLFERAGRVDFNFRLINPIVQLDPTATLYPFKGYDGDDIDDRENNDAKRDQSVLVRVEMHGTKFFNERDLLLQEAV